MDGEAGGLEALATQRGQRVVGEPAVRQEPVALPGVPGDLHEGHRDGVAPLGALVVQQVVELDQLLLGQGLTGAGVAPPGAALLVTLEGGKPGGAEVLDQAEVLQPRRQALGAGGLVLVHPPSLPHAGPPSRPVPACRSRSQGVG